MSSRSPDEPATVTRGVVAAAVAGNAIEFYDFVSYAYFAVYIGKTFFPATSAYLSLLASVSVFGVGFFARPLGAWLIGRYADRRGRRPALLLTMGLMTAGTLGLAVTPSYAAIGVAAPLLLVVARLVQGFALGGDVGPSTAFLLEIAPAHRRAFFTSWQNASQGISAFVAGALGLVLTSTLSPAQMQEWGWRLPFALALLLVPVVLVLRRNMPETLAVPAVDGGERPMRPAAPGLGHLRLVVLGILVFAGATIATYVSTYMATYATATLKLPPTTAMAATMAVGVSLLVGALAGGWWSDAAGPAWPALAPRVGLVVLAPAGLRLLVAHPGLVTLLAVCAMLGALTGMTSSAALYLLGERLALARRASGIALAYAAATAVFGGTTQAVVTWLIAATGSPIAPAWYASATGLASVVALAMLLRPARAPANTD